MWDELSIETAKQTDNGKVTLIIRAKGRINSNTAPKFEKAAKDNIEGTDKVILDFEGLDYISSAGIRVVNILFRSLEYKKENLIVRNYNEQVRETLAITGFSPRITMEVEEHAQGGL
jgi:anti-anti-sigma factor